MRRTGKHKVKEERPETSASISETQDRDLTYLIHDRVELMHQVFSVLKVKELKAMAPHCVQHISLNDLQELCTEELLGISSKRLCAILDGAEPPSDTETSSASSLERFETISLDSISSDEEILSQDSSKKKKHKHCRHRSKLKHKRRSSSEESDNAEKSKASRAGLTVLELLELQARARAIRAQLQQEQAADVTENKAATVQHVSDDEVEIKEVPAEVVEISSEDEKPKVEELRKEMAQTSNNANKDSNKETQTVTKKINDLIITVPQTKHTRKIKLKRNTAGASKTVAGTSTATNNISNKLMADKEKPVGESTSIEKTNKSQRTEEKTPNTTQNATPSQKVITKEKQKKKSKKKGKNKNKEGSDHDEITLQLSDSEKMDLLEDLDSKNYDSVSSSSTEDSESSSDSSVQEETDTKRAYIEERTQVTENISNNKGTSKSPQSKIDNQNNYESDTRVTPSIEVKKTQCRKTIEEIKEPSTVEESIVQSSSESTYNNQSDNIHTTQTVTTTLNASNDKVLQHITENLGNSSIHDKSDEQGDHDLSKPQAGGNTKMEVQETGENANKNDMEKSDGEITDRESSEVEASDVRTEVVCISDEEVNNRKNHKKKKNKKEKKSKKDKKTKDAQDFRNGADQNFYRESEAKDIVVNLIDEPTETIGHHETCVDDDVYEILELSDESSCNEDGNSVLSKEPTTEEIEALSAKIDEIDRNIVTEEEREDERKEAAKEVTEAEGISWKDRYLDSKKVKNVLSTANILNAMRKKNKELKRMLEESKKEIVQIVEEVPEKIESNLEEGTIEQYNTLEGSTKYVDPVKETEDLTSNDGKVTKEMRKDAKQLLKMYKKLLKYNDMNQQKDPNKKKKKKQKKNKEDKKKTVGDTAAQN